MVNFFPNYHALPVFRQEALEKIAGLKAAVNELKKYDLDIQKMRELNARFAAHSGTGMEAEAAEKLARDFLGR